MRTCLPKLVRQREFSPVVNQEKMFLPITLGELIRLLNVSHVLGRAGEETIISRLCIDSRVAEPGTAFFAISGTKVNGEDYVREAFSRGVVVAIVQSDQPEKFKPIVGDQAILFVPDTVQALSKIAHRGYADPSNNLKSIGVTGTNGKTTVSWAIAEALTLLGDKCAHVGTLGFRCSSSDTWEPAVTTTPGLLDLLSFLARCRNTGASAASVEVSSHGVVQRRTLGVNWDVGVFTNITRDHLDFHQTFADYQSAKLAFFTEGLVESKKESKLAVVNVDDPFGQRIIDELGKYSNIQIASFSTKSKALSHLVSAKGDSKNTVISARVFGEEFTFQTKLVGGYNVENLLAVLPVLKFFGYGKSQIEEVMPHVPCVPGRLELVENLRVPIFVDYAHTPDGLVSVQRSLRPLTKGRLITVFGCGGDRDPGKRPLMGEAVAQLSDLAIVTSDNPRSEDPELIIKQIVPGFESAKVKERQCRWETVVDRAQAIREAIRKSEPGDVVLIAGKGHETYQEIKGVRYPFSDREQCVKALEELSAAEKDL